MNPRQLEAFQEVMVTGSVSQAARNLGRTQPAVSNLVARLEEDIGYRLFERGGGRLHPVPEAHFLLQEARPILDRLRELGAAMRGAGALQSGQLRIACMPVVAEHFMPGLISRFVRDREEVGVHLVSQPSPRVYESVASQQFDAGFAEASTRSPLVHADELVMNCLCALRADDPLAQRPSVGPDDLEARALATFLPGHHIRAGIERVFHDAGRRLHVRFEVQNAAAQYTFVEEGLAFAVISPLSARIYRQTGNAASAVAFVPFEPTIPYRAAILTPAHKPRSRLSRAFTAALREGAEALMAG